MYIICFTIGVAVGGAFTGVICNLQMNSLYSEIDKLYKEKNMR